MGTPSDNKDYPADQYCKECNDILIGDEREKGICENCENCETPTDES